MLTCKSCGRKGKYNVGIMLIHPNAEKITENIQTTGYFRCKHCNNARNWEFPQEFFMRAIASLLAKSIDMGSSSDNICEFGKNQLYDGSSHTFISDGEEHLLSQLEQDPLNSFIWNRLGNLYEKGGRPELAASAFEHSLALDFFK